MKVWYEVVLVVIETQWKWQCLACGLGNYVTVVFLHVNGLNLDFLHAVVLTQYYK